MLFWPFMIIGAAVLGLLHASRTEVLMPTTEEEATQAVLFATLFGLLLMVLLGRALLRSGGRGLVRGVSWAAAITTALGVYGFRYEIGDAVDRMRGELVPSVALSHTNGEVELRRNWDGHFRADARINGRRIRMMVDTGASLILIPFERAAAIGIDPELLRFSMPVATANGRSHVAPVRLASVQVGPIVLRDIEAAVAKRGRLSSPLLGMSFLEGLTETTFRGDRMILRHGQVAPRAVIITGDGAERYPESPRYVPLRPPSQAASSHQSGFPPGYGSGLK